MFKTLSNLKYLFMGEASHKVAPSTGLTLQDMESYCEKTLAIHADELLFVRVRFNETDMPDTAADYYPASNSIVINMSASFLSSQADKKGVKWYEILDAVLCHELGHAVDPLCKVYGALMDNATTGSERDALYIKYAYQLELNAFEYGRRFVRHESEYELFNEHSLSVYREIIAKKKGGLTCVQ